MSWERIRPKIGNSLPDYMDEEGGWPTPESDEFWKAACPEDTLAYLADQAKKYAARFEEVKMAFGRCWQMLHEDTADIPPITVFADHQEEIFTPECLRLILTGPMLSEIEDELQIPTEEKNLPFLDVIEKHGKELFGNKYPAPMRSVLWWTLWLYVNFNQARLGGHNKVQDAVELMKNLGLTPPEVL